MSADPEDFDIFLANVERSYAEHDEKIRAEERERVLGIIEIELGLNGRGFSCATAGACIRGVIKRIREGK